MRRCNICGKPVSIGTATQIWNNPHFRDNHPAYAKWYRNWIVRFVSVMIPEIIILVVFLIYWFRSGEDLLILLIALFLYLIPPQLMIFDFARKIGQFKGEWKGNHSERIDQA